MDIKNDVLKAAKGDEQAMERLYSATYQKLRAVTVSILKNEDDAEDILQDSYIKAFSSLRLLEDANKFEAWLCRIASNKCKDYLKKHKPVLFTDVETNDDEPFEWSIEDKNQEFNPEEVVVSQDVRQQIMELVNSLPDEQRICLVYYAVEEMKISEIAELLEVSESTVKSRLKYAKDKMKIKIEELEKKGVKLRSFSGFALIPFLHFLFTTEAKAASAMSFATVSKAVASQIAKHSSTKTAVTSISKVTTSIITKLADMPIVAKIVSGVVATMVVVSIPVVIHQTSTDDNNPYTNVLENNDESIAGKDNNAFWEFIAPKAEPGDNVYFINIGKNCEFDLDGDGKKEIIRVVAQKEYSRFDPTGFYTGSVDVSINDEFYQDLYVGDWIRDNYCIIDIDKSDSKLHLAIQDDGPSDDYSTTIYEYDGKLKEIGSIPGVFDEQFFGETICCGNGTISTYIRFGVFETWFGKASYKLEDSEIALIKQKYYDATKPSSKTLLVDLTVYEKMDLKSKTTVIPEGSNIFIVGTDNKEWLKIKTEDNNFYWIKLASKKNRRFKASDSYFWEKDLFYIESYEAGENSVVDMQSPIFAHKDKSKDSAKFYIEKNTSVTVLEYIDDEWIKIKNNTNGRILYIPINYVSYVTDSTMVNAVTEMKNEDVFDRMNYAG